MIHTMPDKTVRVTSRFPKGQSTLYFDLKRVDGFTLEEDGSRPETFTLKMLGGYTSSGAFYGSAVDAEADLADLNLMLADRHSITAPSLAPSLAHPTARLDMRRKGWGWKGAVAGVALGAGVAYLVTDLHRMDAASRASLQTSLNDTIANGPAAPNWSAIARSTALAQSAPSALQQQSTAPLASAPPRPQLQPQAQARAPAPGASFGLQQ